MTKKKRVINFGNLGGLSDESLIWVLRNMIGSNLSIGENWIKLLKTIKEIERRLKAKEALEEKAKELKQKKTERSNNHVRD
jgi:hypothetical protein